MKKARDAKDLLSMTSNKELTGQWRKKKNECYNVQSGQVYPEGEGRESTKTSTKKKKVMNDN